MSLTVRTATPDDWQAVVEYNHRLALETEGKALDRAILTEGVRACLADPNKGVYYLAVDPATGEVVGQAAVTYEWSDWRNGWFWWYQSVYVRSDWRGRGVLRALFAEVQRRAAEAGDVIGFRLYVENENDPAQQAYEKLGMRREAYQVFGTTGEADRLDC